MPLLHNHRNFSTLFRTALVHCNCYYYTTSGTLLPWIVRTSAGNTSLNDEETQETSKVHSVLDFTLYSLVVPFCTVQTTNNKVIWPKEKSQATERVENPNRSLEGRNRPKLYVPCLQLYFVGMRWNIVPLLERMI